MNDGTLPTDTHYGGNRQCDLGETVSTCASDCHCGDGTCGTYYDHTDTLREEDELDCPEDCTYHCFDGTAGSSGSSTGCYEFHVRHFPVGNWNVENGYDKSYASFQNYCKSWPENAGVFNGGRGACPASGSRRRLLSFKNTLTDWAKKFNNAIKKETKKLTLELGRSVRRKLLSTVKSITDQQTVPINSVGTANVAGGAYKPRGTPSSKPRIDDTTDSVTTRHVAWLNDGHSGYITDANTCLSQQRQTLSYALKEAIDVVLGANGFDDENNLSLLSPVSGTNVEAIEATALADVSSATYSSLSALNLLASLSVQTIVTEVERQMTEAGDCSSAQKAIVHKFSKSWIPTDKCYPLKFKSDYHAPKTEGGNFATGNTVISFDDTELYCRGIAGIIGSLNSGNGGPTPQQVKDDFTLAQKVQVRDSFMSLVHEFSYLSTVDKPNIDSECSLEAQSICSAASETKRGGASKSCLGTDATVDGETFPAKAACLREYKNNLADIAKFISESRQADSSSGLPYTSDATNEFSVAELGSTVFATETHNHRDKFANLRALIGDKFDSSGADLAASHVQLGDQSVLKGSIQACWEEYEQAVGYVEDDEWVAASGALGQAITAVTKVESAIIATHIEAKAECKLKCKLDNERHQWSYLVNACEYNDLPASGHNHEGPGTCECVRDSNTLLTDVDDINKVKCHCRMGQHYTDFIGDSGRITEDCQVEPEAYITSRTTNSQISSAYSGSLDIDGSSFSAQGAGEYALVYAGRQPTTAVESDLNAIITKSDGDIATYVNSIVTNLQKNLEDDGLLAQQGAQTLRQVCHRIHNAIVSSERETLALSNAAAMDNFYDNYMNTIQSGSLADSTATRRLSSEPCVLCD